MWCLEDYGSGVSNLPKYNFQCLKCKAELEVECSIKDTIKPPVCCSKKAKRVYYPVGAVFKGTGWGKDKK